MTMFQISNQEVISRTGLSSIGDIISCRRLGLFGHVAQLDSDVPARDALESSMPMLAVPR